VGKKNGVEQYNINNEACGWYHFCSEFFFHWSWKYSCL